MVSRRALSPKYRTRLLLEAAAMMTENRKAVKAAHRSMGFDPRAGDTLRSAGAVEFEDIDPATVYGRSPTAALDPENYIREAAAPADDSPKISRQQRRAAERAKRKNQRC